MAPQITNLVGDFRCERGESVAWGIHDHRHAHQADDAAKQSHPSRQKPSKIMPQRMEPAAIDRGKRLGLSLEGIGDVLALWRTGNCGHTRSELEQLLGAKLVGSTASWPKPAAFQRQLTDTCECVVAAPTPEACRPDCGC